MMLVDHRILGGHRARGSGRAGGWHSTTVDNDDTQRRRTTETSENAAVREDDGEMTMKPWRARSPGVHRVERWIDRESEEQQEESAYQCASMRPAKIGRATLCFRRIDGGALGGDGDAATMLLLLLLLLMLAGMLHRKY